MTSIRKIRRRAKRRPCLPPPLWLMQQRLNTAMRQLLDNMALACGPLVRLAGVWPDLPKRSGPTHYERKAARERVRASGGYGLDELLDRIAGWTGPEISGSVSARSDTTTTPAAGQPR